MHARGGALFMCLFSFFLWGYRGSTPTSTQTIFSLSSAVFRLMPAPPMESDCVCPALALKLQEQPPIILPINAYTVCRWTHTTDGGREAKLSWKAREMRADGVGAYMESSFSSYIDRDRY
ncbi:hypothetical protein CC80DRAFT_153713 [Byssothecium circinans]|uniref:Secreted protein n=1 Tax=Byssothecium circinans TaxID=147558 RepID=A0A6A5UBI7_9PLEO|nr:hypothetical protein CC80DRAFT_153713 [Byssothecium circinans]